SRRPRRHRRRPAGGQGHRGRQGRRRSPAGGFPELRGLFRRRWAGAELMTAAYDKGVKNLIPGLNATGHVTHTQHRKDMVTIHHNGGRLSHEGVLNVWKTRPASAHFDVDSAGAVAQYVEMNEYAWACGNTEGNQRSISIEMCNEATNGSWPVSETTWRSAARLAGWIFAKVIGTRPTNGNLVPHHHWKSTTCAGPYMDAHFGDFIKVAQQAYDFFKGGG